VIMDYYLHIFNAYTHIIIILLYTIGEQKNKLTDLYDEDENELEEEGGVKLTKMKKSLRSLVGVDPKNYVVDSGYDDKDDDNDDENDDVENEDVENDPPVNSQIIEKVKNIEKTRNNVHDAQLKQADEM